MAGTSGKSTQAAAAASASTFAVMHGGAPAPRIKALESIRGLAAMLVVVHHMPDWNARLYDVALIRNSYLLVDLFFVLSGFVIYNAYSTKIVSLQELGRFQFLRFGRLYPVHLVLLAVFVAFEVSKYFAHAKLGVNMPNTEPFKESGAVALIEQLLLVQAIGPTGNALTYNAAAWSISVEFYTYLIFALVLVYAAERKHLCFGVLAVSAVTLLVTQTTFGSTDLIRCIAGFFIGCLSAAAAARFRVKLPRSMPGIAIIALLLFLQFKPDSRFNSVTCGITAVLILSLVSQPSGRLQSALNSRLLTWMGTISYSIYMSHPAVIWIVNQFLRIVLKAPQLYRGERMTPQLPVVEAAICYVLVIGMVLAVSEATYRWIEVPFRRKSRSLVLAGERS